MKGRKGFFIKVFEFNNFFVDFINAARSTKVNKRLHQWKHKLIKPDHEIPP